MPESEKVKSAVEKGIERAEAKLAEAAAEDTTPEDGAKTPTPEELTPQGGKETMGWPLPVYPLVAKFDVQVVELEDQQTAVVLAMYTGAGATFGLLSREGTLALAQKLKKAGNSMILGTVQ